MGANPQHPNPVEREYDFEICNRCNAHHEYGKHLSKPMPSISPNPVGSEELEKLLAIRWGINKIYGFGGGNKGSQSWWEIPDDVREKLKVELEAWRDRAVVEAKDQAYADAQKHLYTPSQIRYALERVLQPKTSPGLVKAILEDLGDELARLTKEENKHEAN